MKRLQYPFSTLPAFMLGFCGLLLCGCGFFSEEEAGVQIGERDLLQIPLRQGFHRAEIDAGDAGTLRLSVAVPDLPAGQHVPLVIALHYAPANFEGEIDPYYAEGYLQGLAEPGLRDLGAIIVAPDVPSGGNWLDANSRDVVLELIEAAKVAWPIDPDRVVVTGYSMGGIGAWYMADIAPNVFSAGIPMGAMPVGDFSGEVPLFVIHGANDTLFDLGEVEATVAFMQNNGARVQLIVAPGLTHTQATAYVPFLQGAVVWLEEKIWQEDNHQSR